MSREQQQPITVMSSRRRSMVIGRHKPARSVALFCQLLAAGLLFAAGCGKNDDTATADAIEAEQSEKENARVSVELGSFRVREPRPIENLTIDLRFALQAVVQEKDQDRFEHYVASHENKLRDQIILAVRTAETPEFDEPQLDRLRHRILLRIASVQGELTAEDLYVTDYHCQID